MMQIAQNDAAAPLKLTKAILLYSSTGHGTTDLDASIHDVLEDARGALEIGAGATLTQEAINDILMQLRKVAPIGILPENLLSLGEHYMLWWTPPQSRTAWFKTGERTPCGNRSGRVFYPTLLYAVIHGHLHVYAANGKTRPTEATTLFHAPLMNVWDSGKVCTGNVEFPRTATVDTLSRWEAALLDSFYTHPNHSRAVKGIKGGIGQLYADMLDGKHKSFPSKHLAPSGMTLGKLLQQIQQGQTKE